MRLIGFNFKKISAEKFFSGNGQVKINANITLEDIIKIGDEILKSKEELISVSFTYTLDYQKDFAKVEFSGNLILSVDPKQVKEVLKEWKEKKIPEDFRMAVYNIILRKSNIKALFFEDEIGLPPHIQLPYFKKEENSNKDKNTI